MIHFIFSLFLEQATLVVGSRRQLWGLVLMSAGLESKGASDVLFELSLCCFLGLTIAINWLATILTINGPYIVCYLRKLLPCCHHKCYCPSTHPAGYAKDT